MAYRGGGCAHPRPSNPDSNWGKIEGSDHVFLKLQLLDSIHVDQRRWLAQVEGEHTHS